MFDLGISKLMLIGVVALVVIGPERLPKVARTVGALMGKAQRYVQDVKREVSQAIELDELRKAKASVEGAARDLEQSVRTHASAFEQEVSHVSREVQGLAQQAAGQGDADVGAWESMPDAGAGALADGELSRRDFMASASAVVPVHVPHRKNWRSRRSAVPAWYKARQQVRTRLRSGAARAASRQAGQS